jgi:hypothetical protein
MDIRDRTKLDYEFEELAPLEEPDLPAADEALRKELLPVPSADDQRDLYDDIMVEYGAAILDRADWETDAATDEEQYLGVLPDKNDPWPGAANFNVPLTMLGVETLKPRLIESILGGDPLVYAVPTETMDEPRTERTELFLNWQLNTDLDIRPLVEESAHTFLTPGIVVAKVLWETVERPINQIHHFTPDTGLDDIFRGLFGDELPQEWTQKDGQWAGHLKTPGGARRKVEATFKYLEDEIQVLLRKDHIAFEGPRIHLIDPMDFVAPFKGGSDIQRLPWLVQRLHYSEQDLRRKVKQGRFYADAVKRLLGEVEAGTPDPETPGQALAAVQAGSEGVAVDPASSVLDEQYDVYERYGLRDMDDDGIDEEVIVWTSPQLPGEILGWDYLDNVVHHGRRPFVVGRYLRLPNRFYGLSFPRIVRDIQDEINTMHNQRVDAGTIQNTPMGFFRASMTMRPDTMRIKPGTWTGVDNPQTDIFIPQWNGSPVFGNNEEALLYQYFERLTGLTDLALGRQPNRVGATRTASGTAALLSEAGLRFKTSMEAFQRFWKEIFEHVLWLDQQYLPPGKEFRVTGRVPEMVRLEHRGDIAGRYDLRLSTTSETLNKSVLREDATVKLNLVSNPLYLQMGLIGIKGLRRQLRASLRAYGEQDPEMTLEPLTQAIVRTPDQELAMMLGGDDRVEPTMMENLTMHLEAHMEQMQDPTVQRNPELLKRVQVHLAKTNQMAMMQAMAMQASQGKGKPMGGPVAGEQAMNAQIGRQADQPSQMGGGTSPGPSGG